MAAKAKGYKEEKTTTHQQPSTTSEQEKTTSRETTTKHDETTTELTTDVTTENNDDFVCPEQWGYYADPKNCIKYYSCEAGVQKRKTCGKQKGKLRN